MIEVNAEATGYANEIQVFVNQGSTLLTGCVTVDQAKEMVARLTKAIEEAH